MTSRPFLLPQDAPYYLFHSTGPLTQAGKNYLTDFYLSPWEKNGAEAWPQWLGVIDKFCSGLASLLGGNPEDYCPQPNLSAAMTRYLMALPKAGKKRTILMHAQAFPSMGFVVQALDRFGYKLNLIPANLPPQDPQIWEDHITAETAAILITHVHSNTGLLSPVKTIAALAQDHDIYVMVDIAQSAGLVPINISSWPVNAVFGSCVKWLCGGAGAGFMWINPTDIKTLIPLTAGWFSHEDPFEFNIEDFRYRPDSRRFWGGTPAIASYALAVGGIETIKQLGVATIRAHNLELLKIACPDKDFAHNGGTLCYRLDEKAEYISEALLKHSPYFDRRGNILRLSFHITNTQDHARTVFDLLHP